MEKRTKVDPHGPVLITEDFADPQPLIAHRFPLLLVDRFKVIKSGEEGLGVKNVTSTEDFLVLGIDGREKRLPATLVVEALAQASAAVMGRFWLDQGEPRLHEGFLVRVESFTFTGDGPAPGDVMVMYVKVNTRRKKYFRSSTRAEVNGRTIAEGDLTFALK